MIYEFNGNLINGLYYFYSGWASKCRLIQDRLEKISKANPDLVIVRINTTKYPGLKKNFEVTRIPSYLFIKDGKVIKRLNGNVDLMTLTKWINEE